MANHVILDRLWNSDKLSKCSMKAQLHYPRIYLICDDWACFEIDVISIHKTAYPKMPSVKPKDIFEWLKEYVDNGLLFVWSDGHNEYGYWTGPEEGRLLAPSRRHKKRTPEPPIDDLSIYQQKHNKATSDYKLTTKGYKGLQDLPVRGLRTGLGLRTGTGLGLGEKPGTKDYKETFEEFWLEYPNKKEKKAAYEKWNSRIREKVNPDDLIKAAKNYAHDCTNKETDLKFIKLGKTFLGSKKPYEDYINPEDHKFTSPKLKQQADQCNKEATGLKCPGLEGKLAEPYCEVCIRIVDYRKSNMSSGP